MSGSAGMGHTELVGQLVKLRADCQSAPSGGCQPPRRISSCPTTGFTLLEMLVATMIMGVAVVGLLSNLSTSLRNAARLTEYDRAALLAKRKMDELLLDTRLPKDVAIEARFDPATTGVEGGWRARLATFEEPPKVAPGIAILERLELQVWWMSGAHRRVLSMEAFRSAMILPPNLAGGGGTP